MDETTPTHSEMLEFLIEKAYGGFKDANNVVTVTIGEWIKMMDLHRKLAPEGSDRKEFWEMVEQIRRDKLPAGKKPPGVKKLTKPKTGRSKK